MIEVSAINGYPVKPPMATLSTYCHIMGKRQPKRSLPTDLRKVLGAQLVSLMAKHQDLNTQMKVKAKSGLGQRTIGRALDASTAANLDTIQALAKAFGVHPYELLLEPAAPQALGRLADPNLNKVNDMWHILLPQDRKAVVDLVVSKAEYIRAVKKETGKVPEHAPDAKVAQAYKIPIARQEPAGYRVSRVQAKKRTNK